MVIYFRYYISRQDQTLNTSTYGTYPAKIQTVFVRNLDILMFDLIQKITHNKVVAYMCTCSILSLLRLEINIANTVNILKRNIIV